MRMHKKKQKKQSLSKTASFLNKDQNQRLKAAKERSILKPEIENSSDEMKRPHLSF